MDNKMTLATKQTLQNYILEVIENSSKCATCVFHNEFDCMFSYDCVKNDFKLWKGEVK